MAQDTQVSVDPRTVGSNAFLEGSKSLDEADPAGIHPSKMVSAEALRYRHPDYLGYAPKWEKYLDCYLAREIIKYIHRHARETTDSYNNRVKRGYYFNYVQAIVDLFVSYLFQSGISRSAGDSESLREYFSDFYEDCDRSGTKYSTFMQDAEKIAILCGHVGILVNMPRAPDGGFLTEAERKNAGHWPYLTLVSPLQILDWEVDEEENFEWVKIEVTRPQNRGWKKLVDTSTRYFEIWTKNSWELWKLTNDQAEIVDTGTHNLGAVPLVIAHNDSSLTHPWFGESAVRDICDINIAILNWCSFADEEVANRCLNILTMERAENDAPLKISQYNVIEYEPGASAPSYLTPGATPLELIGKQIDRARDEIYRLAKLGGSTGLLGVREATSGVAYAFEFNETNQSLCGKAEYLEQAELDIHRLIAKWLGEDFTGTITYPREFGVDDILMELQFLAESRTSFSSDTAIKTVERRVIDKLFAKENQSLRDEIEKEIEEADTKPRNSPFGPIGTFAAGSKQEGNGSVKKEKPEKREEISKLTTGVPQVIASTATSRFMSPTD